jgi:CheY-like chemotaxis protein
MATILFVDDDPVTLELMGQAAKLLGHEGMLARSGKEALEKAANQAPGLIFLDLMMPDMDGMAVLKALKADERSRDIPVVILSAGAGLDDAILAKEAGAQGYLAKPLPLQELMDSIKRYCG